MLENHNDSLHNADGSQESAQQTAVNDVGDAAEHPEITDSRAEDPVNPEPEIHGAMLGIPAGLEDVTDDAELEIAASNDVTTSADEVSDDAPELADNEPVDDENTSEVDLSESDPEANDTTDTEKPYADETGMADSGSYATSENNEQEPGADEDTSSIVAEVPEIEQNDESDLAESLSEENIITLTPEQLADDSLVIENGENQAVQAIADANAEEGEHESPQDIPMQDYESLSMENLTGELEKLVGVEKVLSVKNHVEEIRKAFQNKYNHFIEEKRSEWQAANPESTEDFQFEFPLKSRFDKLYSQYRDRKNAHFKSQERNLQGNLELRMAIVEEIKNLINPQEKIKDTLKHFNGLRDRWKNAGPIPKDKYNHVWNNYHFHVENFYDYLHLDREARDVDFKHNLDQKQKIIARVEELVHEQDINKSFRELQDLHRIWKEEIGPVSREYREQIWEQFSDLTKNIHDKRESHLEQFRAVERENLEKKKEIISKLEALAQEKVGSHNAWIGQMGKVDALRNEFFAIGKVPAEVNEQTWTSFKNTVRNFNILKNSFYKEIKKDQNDNLSRKQALIEKAKSLQDSDDFAATTPIMKQVQDEWKQIGHVPRKFSDKLWNDFRAACNHYFERLKENRNAEDPEEVASYENKKNYMDMMREFAMTGDHKTDLDAIKKHIENWKGFGKVPVSKRHVEGKFNKILDGLFEKLSLSKKETDMMRFTNRVDNLSVTDDSRKLENEKIFLMRKVEEVQSEILQLENNIQFFTNGKKQHKENPMVTEVRKNIEKHKEELVILKVKLKQLRSVGKE